MSCGARYTNYGTSAQPAGSNRRLDGSGSTHVDPVNCTSGKAPNVGTLIRKCLLQRGERLPGSRTDAREPYARAVARSFVWIPEQGHQPRNGQSCHRTDFSDSLGGERPDAWIDIVKRSDQLGQARMNVKPWTRQRRPRARRDVQEECHIPSDLNIGVRQSARESGKSARAECAESRVQFVSSLFDWIDAAVRARTGRQGCRKGTELANNVISRVRLLLLWPR
jgi:hypothetical protein